MSPSLRAAFLLCLGLSACKVVDVVGDAAVVCEQGDWAQCVGFDGSGRVPFEPAQYGMTFHVHTHARLNGVGCETSGDCTPYVEDGALSLNSEDGGYGMDVLRFLRPFDFANREGHIHYRSDLKGRPRVLQVVQVTPTLTNTLPDLRNGEGAFGGPAITISYYGEGGQPFAIVTWRDGVPAQQFFVEGPLGIAPGQLHDVDIHVTRESVRILLDGESIFDQRVDDLGFTRGYVYIGQASNEPPKDGVVGNEANRVLWDDLAFDGPVLAPNALTPLDTQDVLFRAWDGATCTVRGVSADGAPTPGVLQYETWHVRLDAAAPPVELGDISCTRYETVTPHSGEPLIGDIEIVTQ